jgi:hypothetical protein
VRAIAAPRRPSADSRLGSLSQGTMLMCDTDWPTNSQFTPIGRRALSPTWPTWQSCTGRAVCRTSLKPLRPAPVASTQTRLESHVNRSDFVAMARGAMLQPAATACQTRWLTRQAPERPPGSDAKSSLGTRQKWGSVRRTRPHARMNSSTSHCPEVTMQPRSGHASIRRQKERHGALGASNAAVRDGLGAIRFVLAEGPIFRGKRGLSRL